MSASVIFCAVLSSQVLSPSVNYRTTQLYKSDSLNAFLLTETLLCGQYMCAWRTWCMYILCATFTARDTCAMFPRCRWDTHKTFQLCAGWTRLIRAGSTALRSLVLAIRGPAGLAPNEPCRWCTTATSVKGKRRTGVRSSRIRVSRPGLNRCRAKRDTRPRLSHRDPSATELTSNKIPA